MQNKNTGSILELPPPDSLGASCIKIDGKVVELVLYSDENGGIVTLGSGRMFAAGVDFSSYVLSLIADAPEKP